MIKAACVSPSLLSDALISITLSVLHLQSFTLNTAPVNLHRTNVSWAVSSHTCCIPLNADASVRLIFLDSVLKHNISTKQAADVKRNSLLHHWSLHLVFVKYTANRHSN